MPAGDRYYPISQSEFEQFLLRQKFVKVIPDAITKELVYSKIVGKCKYGPICLRIYSGINPNGESRDIGKDAIRLCLFYKKDNEVIKCGNFRKCLRVLTWKKNVQAAIDAWQELYEVCDCGSPMILRENKTTKQQFWACCDWKKDGSGCRKSKPFVEKE